ncbi:PAS domain S-box protein [Beggiatoa alba]|nr:PAS domain S-box protein [Beggiatoa alba]
MSSKKRALNPSLSMQGLVSQDILQKIIDQYLKVSITDTTGHIVYVNDKFCEVSGYRRDELIGADHSIVKSGNHSLEFFREMWEKILQGETWQGQIENRRKNGDLCWIQTSITPVLNEQGKAEHFISICADITQQVQSKYALEKFKQILDQTLDSVFIFNAESLAFSYVNLGAVEQVGYTKPELLNMTPVEIKPEFNESKFRAILLPLLNNEVDSFTFETVHQHKSGERIPVEIFLQYFPESDDVGQFIAIVRDISDRKRLEQKHQRMERQVQQAQKMEAIGQLTAGIAHDFNNILASIIGYTDLAMTRCVGEGEDKLMGYLEQVYTAGKRARDLIQQMMIYSRSTVAAESLIDPQQLVKETVKLLYSTLPTSIQLNFDSVDESQFVISIEPVQLQQIVMNLCINARDAMHGKGQLDLRLEIMRNVQAECASCHETIQGDYVVLSVRDNGDGMAVDALDHLFEPFFTTKKVGEGTGLGLSVVHGIMHEHQGHIRVESIAGQGTTFYLLFPVLGEVSAEKQQAAVVPLPSKILMSGPAAFDKYLLVVDDEPGVLGFLKDCLERSGFKVIAFEKSVDALAYLCSHLDEIGLLITDQTMPDITGVELIKMARAVSPQLPTILCSGYLDDVDKRQIESSEISFLAEKPFDRTKLLLSINQLVGIPLDD